MLVDAGMAQRCHTAWAQVPTLRTPCRFIAIANKKRAAFLRPVSIPS